MPSSLTARQLAGQRVIYSYPGLTPPAGLLALIRDGAAAGVIFFGDNISSHAQIAAVIKTLETADADPSNPVRAPLLLMTDQEGGQVRRLSGAPVLSEKQIAGSAHPANEVEAAGSGAGENLKGVGMNVNLARYSTCTGRRGTSLISSVAPTAAMRTRRPGSAPTSSGHSSRWASRQ